MCEVSASNVKLPPRKYAIKKRMLIFGEYLHAGKFHYSIQTFKNCKETKCKKFLQAKRFFDKR